MSYISLHNHTHYSNIRLLDAIIKENALIDKAYEIGLNGVAITDHEVCSSFVKAEKHLAKRQKQNPDDERWQDFKLIRGNEIYLCRDGLNNTNFESGKDKYFHFLLLAKDEIGNQQIRKLSSRAWARSYYKFMRRVPTYYQDLYEILGKNKGHVIGSTACLAGQLGSFILEASRYEFSDRDRYHEIYEDITYWLDAMTQYFDEDDFYLEIQPSKTQEQIYVNKKILELGKKYHMPVIVTTDSHYLTKEDRVIHKAYLNSKEGEREVDAFYASTYLMTQEEITDYLVDYVDEITLQKVFDNTNAIGDKCKNYSIAKKLKIPYIPIRKIPEYPLDFVKNIESHYEYMVKFATSPHQSDRDLFGYLYQFITENLELSDTLTKKRLEQIEIELKAFWVSSEAQSVRWSAYLLQMSDYIDILWNKGDTLVGAGRGSGVGCYILYILGITQIDPTREIAPLYYWRFINPERASVLDIDIDIQGNRRDGAIGALKDVYGKERVVKVATFGTEKARSAILTACRGLGVDVDIAQYLSSMIKSERGIQHTLQETFYGDVEKEISPNKQFIDEMTRNYPQVWKVAQSIEGLVCRNGQHAGGVIIVDEDFTDCSAIMTTTKGEVVSQFELHDEEELSHIKIDLLVVEALDKIRTCLDLLLEYGYAEPKSSLKETYESIIGVYNLEREDQNMWKLVWDNQIISLFQMEKSSGIQGISLTKPKSLEDLATLNSVIRLMAQEKGAEQPLNKYARFKDNPQEWIQEMRNSGLSEEEQTLLKSFLEYEYGICAVQEDIMSMVQHPAIGGFSLTWADKLRKSIAKKKPEEFNKLTAEFFENAEKKQLSENLVLYVWDTLIKTQRGYGFNLSHTLAYSIIGLQEMNLAYRYPILFWNTANLIVDSGGQDGTESNTWTESEDELHRATGNTDSDGEDLLAVDDDEDEEEVAKKKNKTVDYGKISSAIGKMQAYGITILPPNINKSKYTFTPDVEQNAILFGIKGITRIGDQMVEDIISNRPYASIEDLQSKVKVNRLHVINLIKSGSLDRVIDKPRDQILFEYLASLANTKQKLTLQNMQMLIKEQLIPPEYEFYKKLFNFNKHIKASKKQDYYILDLKAINFYEKFYDVDILVNIDDEFAILQKEWDKIYKKAMTPMREFLKDPDNDILKTLNYRLISTEIDKYAKGSISKWEMDSISFYYHEHELAQIDEEEYNIRNFFTEPEEGRIVKVVEWKGKSFPIYDIYRIAGTVLDKDPLKNTITLLTKYGVVMVKVWQAQFVKYNKQVSRKLPTGKKQIIEKSWFSRGNKLLVTGYRRGDMFVPKIYSNHIYDHPFDLIESINDKNRLILRGERMQ